MCGIVTFSLRSNFKSTCITKTVHLAFCFARGSVAYLAGCALVQECVSMATLICAHGPTVLTNPDLVTRVHLLCPPGYDTDYK